MQRYTIRPNEGKRRHMRVEYFFEAPHDNPRLMVSYWRPGRYERGNFVKNFIGVRVESAGNELNSRKISPHQWEVDARKGEALKVTYELYAGDLSAGNTYCDRNFLLINPVNALMYTAGLEDAPSELEVELPADWQAVTPMELVRGRACAARNLQHLMDSPILAAANLRHLEYEVEGVHFHIDIYGETELDEEQVVEHFRAFTEAQIRVFGGFPTRQYRFMLLFMPVRMHHGVEHEESTVIILGPAEDLTKPEMYAEFLGVSSHELYHTWNVKRFRPAEWTPYDFTGPSASRLGYVAEGITTYMGDKLLWQSGVFEDADFLRELAVHLQRHKHGKGRLNLSLADSSVDTWVDGYGRGTPHRRVSIYGEGAMFAFVLDQWLFEASGGSADLSTVMRKMYATVDPAKGFTEDEFWDLMADTADADWVKLRAEVIDGRGFLESYFYKALEMVGLKVVEKAPASNVKSAFGLHLEEIDGRMVVWNIAPDSPADHGDLAHDDIVLEINEADAKTFMETDHGFSPVSLRMSCRSGYKRMREMLKPDGRVHFHDIEIKPTATRPGTPFHRWKTLGFRN